MSQCDFLGFDHCLFSIKRGNGHALIVAADGIDATVSMAVPMDRADLAAQNAGNRSDIWHSRDGVHWVQQPPVLQPPSFLPRHASSVCVHAGALMIMAGNAVADDGSWDVSDVWALRPKEEGVMSQHQRQSTL